MNLIHSFQLAQPIRLLLKYVGEDFEDKHYECGPGWWYLNIDYDVDNANMIDLCYYMLRKRK